MWALIDCNSFFANVERVFHPGLRHKPVCVLSSNDGIIVALTPEAKALGLHRGDALFKVRDRHQTEQEFHFLRIYLFVDTAVIHILQVLWESSCYILRYTYR